MLGPGLPLGPSRPLESTLLVGPARPLGLEPVLALGPAPLSATATQLCSFERRPPAWRHRSWPTWPRPEPWPRPRRQTVRRPAASPPATQTSTSASSWALPPDWPVR